MKKTYALSKTTLLAMFMILSVVFACKDDDEPTPDTSDIAATWELQAITPATAGTTIPNLALIEANVPCLYDLKLTFKSDNTIATADCPLAVTTIDMFVPISGSKWKVEGDKLTLTNEAKNISQTYKYTISGSDLKVNVSIAASAGSPAIDAILSLKKV